MGNCSYVANSSIEELKTLVREYLVCSQFVDPEVVLVSPIRMDEAVSQ